MRNAEEEKYREILLTSRRCNTANSCVPELFGCHESHFDIFVPNLNAWDALLYYELLDIIHEVCLETKQNALRHQS